MPKFLRSPVVAAVLFLIGAGIAQSTVYKWSQTAGSNGNSDSTINWAEGMAPSAVNDSARAMMAAIAKWRDDMSGSLTTGGTSTAYTITSNQGFSSLSAMSGQTIRVKMHTANGASPTLNVDGLGAKSIVSITGTFVGSGVLRTNGIYDLVYNNSGGDWTVVGLTSEFASGTKIAVWQSTCPAGWTQQTNATLDNAAIASTSGASGGTTGGTTGFTSVFAARTITQANLPSYTLPNTLGASITDPGHTHSYTAPTQSPQVGTGGANFDNGTSSSTTGSSTTGITASITGSVTSGGSGTAMDFATKYIVMAICSKD